MPPLPSPTLGPRAVTDADFPADGTAEAQLGAMLNWAVQAPSVLNTQPWRFRIDGRTAEVYVDRSRRLAPLDRDGREAILSCGAALFTLKLAARHYGFATVEERPTPDGDPDLVGRLTLDGASPATDAEEALFAAVKRRHTNRDPYADFAVPRALLTQLEDAAQAEGAVLHVMDDVEDRAAIATLIADAIRHQANDPATVAVLRAWLRPAGDARADGVPDAVQGGWDRLSYLDADARFTASQARRLAEAAPALLVLSTDGDRPVDWTRAGAALQRVLLTAAGHDLTASYFNQPTEVPALRRQLSAVVRPGHPQVVFRLGLPSEARGTPRRRVADVLRPEAE